MAVVLRKYDGNANAETAGLDDKPPCTVKRGTSQHERPITKHRKLENYLRKTHGHGGFRKFGANIAPFADFSIKDMMLLSCIKR
jgi:hypothetical protein